MLQRNDSTSFLYWQLQPIPHIRAKVYHNFHSICIPEHAIKTLRIEDFSQAVIANAEYVAPYLNQLIPMDCITVENAKKMASCLQRNFFPAPYHAMRCVYPAKYVSLLCADLGVV